MGWVLWLVAGLISIAGGFFALANPFVATLAAEQIAGWMFAFVGAMVIVSAFSDKGWTGWILSLILGVLVLIFGISLISNPLAGVLTLTALSAILMAASGIAKVLLAFTSQAQNLRGILIVSGLISVVLAGMIIANWPQSALLVLGIYLSIELISNGISLVVLAFGRKAVEDSV